MKKLMLIFMLCSLAGAADRCVRSGASGTGSGADWTNAYTALPATLTRGDTYYIADGEYAAYDFNDATSSDLYIYIKKATSLAHGTSTGWSSGYGDGVASWGTLTFTTSYTIFDGVVGGFPTWESGHGFKVQTANTANIRATIVGGSGVTIKNISILHTELSGPMVEGISTGVYGYCTSADTIRIAYCWIHGHGEGLVRGYNFKNSILEYNAFSTNPFATPEHHGSGVTFWNTTSDVHVRYNRFRSINGSGWLGLYVGNHTRHCWYGNVFFADSIVDHSTNGVVYNADSPTCTTSTWLVHNNTFFNLTNIPCIARYTVLGSGCEAKNNLSYKYVAHEGGVMVSGFTAANNDSATVNPFVDTTTKDFHLTSNTSAGSNLGTPFNYDIDAVIRGTWSRGAYEFVDDAFIARILIRRP
jgi:hypothetical protein